MENTMSISNYITHNLRLFPDIGNVIPYDDLCEILFASKIKEIPRMELLQKGYTVNANDANDSTIYFKLEKLEEFIKLCFSKVNFENKEICPINYFYLAKKQFGDIEIPNTYKHLFDVIDDFVKFLKLKDDINSKTILNHFWNNIFKGTVTSFNEEPFMLTMKFTKRNGFPFIMNFCEFQSSLKNVVCINSIGEIRTQEFEKIFHNWTQEILMDNPDNYVTSCLETVTGSRDMATFIFESHMNKKSHIIDVNDLNQIIRFASSNKRTAYLENFMKIYQNKNIFNLEDDKMFLNFEGFNKYLLNLEESYLHNFQEKENINELYYNVMDELVNSYQRLYTYTKLI